MILPKVRDPRFIMIRRDGTLRDDDHHRLAMWAADCAGHVLAHFERARPKDRRPRRAIELARAWARGEVTTTEARTAAGHANVAAHELGAAAYGIKAERAAVPKDAAVSFGRRECRRQRDRLPRAIRALVLDDERLRNEICRSVFDR